MRVGASNKPTKTATGARSEATKRFEYSKRCEFHTAACFVRRGRFLVAVAFSSLANTVLTLKTHPPSRLASVVVAGRNPSRPSQTFCTRCSGR